MDLIDSRRAFGCIIGWVPFNEGWGQFDTVRLAKWIKEYDPSRLVDPASGWTDFPVGDVHDTHDYPVRRVRRPLKGGRPCWASSAGSACRSPATYG